MRVLMLPLLALLAFALPPAAAAQNTPFAPVAVVNGEAITGFDVQQRIKMMRLISNLPADSQELTLATLDALIEDRLKLQEGKRLGIEPTDELISGGLQRLAQQRGQSPEAFLQRLRRGGVAESAIRDSVGAEVVWREVVRGRFLSRVDPADAEVDAEIGLISQGGAAEGVSYRLQEIGLPNPAGGSAEGEARALYQRLRDGADFTQAVKQHSRAPSADNDGKLGWVEARRLPPDLARAVATLQPGQVAEPMPVAAGWSIVKLLEVKRDAGAAPQVDAETRERIRARMIEARIGRLADGLLQELRRDALIQLR